LPQTITGAGLEADLSPAAATAGGQPRPREPVNLQPDPRLDERRNRMRCTAVVHRDLAYPMAGQSKCRSDLHAQLRIQSGRAGTRAPDMVCVKLAALTV
jgi:hypothetical protein